VDPQVCQLLNPSTMGPFSPAHITGGTSLVNVLASAGASVGCAAAVPQSSPAPPASGRTQGSAQHRHARVPGKHRQGKHGPPHN
jgi:hypothetical protein